ncbi:hypothetical protein [Erwinia amylovora]|uniref:Uncharacterized protein n=3 Tax=Erwinia amylovora TaxID=552 RepID=A0A830ZQ86_ERWAM|nr:hypothetical protein [Erwinia amylovora]CCO77340.1 hypothetical protein BN432_0508 [Erwinia amylovora Ea356]ATZ12680.1 hypothetical protein AD997_15070 [Erwinia amylovora]EKV55346.1 hypothetical protein EaACW_0495 [Erwinia amylovora ACW56400]MBZ2399517.1 hypothetical protein [Erwinia amylovora]MBZ2402080.1 hypothetical protein [Erwinia amylovora]
MKSVLNVELQTPVHPLIGAPFFMPLRRRDEGRGMSFQTVALCRRRGTLVSIALLARVAVP